jgi:hypothetical protein
VKWVLDADTYIYKLIHDVGKEKNITFLVFVPKSFESTEDLLAVFKGHDDSTYDTLQTTA